MRCGDEITGKISKLHPDSETCYQDRGLTFAIKDKVIVIIRGRAPKAQGRGSNFFFSRGGPDFSNQGGPGGGSLQKFFLEFHRVIHITKNIENWDICCYK